MEGNAKIISTMLGYEDHGMLTCFLHLEQDSVGQGFGGYRLDKSKGWSIYTDFWIKRILETVGVNRWEGLKGKHIRVKGMEFGVIEGIGHITNDKWFFPDEELKTLRQEV